MYELASQTAVTKELKDISNKATQVPLDMEMHFQERNHDVSKCEALNLKSWEEEGEDTELDLSMESGLHDRKQQNFTALGPTLPSQCHVPRYLGLTSAFVDQEKKHDAPGFISVKHAKWGVFWNVKKKKKESNINLVLK